MADHITPLLISYGDLILLQPGSRVEGESMSFEHTYTAESVSLVGANHADLSDFGNVSERFDLTTVQTYASPRDAQLAFMQHEADWADAPHLSQFVIASPSIRQIYRAAISSRSPSIDRLTRLRISYSFILTTPANHETHRPTIRSEQV